MFIFGFLVEFLRFRNSKKVAIFHIGKRCRFLTIVGNWQSIYMEDLKVDLS
jgi:hypothetical protein